MVDRDSSGYDRGGIDMGAELLGSSIAGCWRKSVARERSWRIEHGAYVYFAGSGQWSCRIVRSTFCATKLLRRYQHGSWNNHNWPCRYDSRLGVGSSKASFGDRLP